MKLPEAVMEKRQCVTLALAAADLWRQNRNMGRWSSSAVHRYLEDGGKVAESSGRMARASTNYR